MELLIRAKLAAGCGGLEGIGGIVRRSMARSAVDDNAPVQEEKEEESGTCAWMIAVNSTRF